ncbi:ABC transporter ATP-binding protein [Pseudonocardia xishanensis]|uniref:ABC-type multidrug transport system fused ATPase/permease subunit n=1 Tax=Pseudonocardia xishanensis TaxID=630995 RepID=A0ABP8RTL8_9PSEU
MSVAVGPRRSVCRWARGSVVRAVFLAVVVLVGAAASAATPLVIGRVVDRLAAGEPVMAVVPLVVVAGAAGAVAAVLVGVRTVVSQRIAEDVVAAARRDTHVAVIGQNPLRLERGAPGAALAALTVDIEALRSAFREAVPEVVAAVALFAWAMVVMLSLSPLLTAVALLGVPFVVLAGIRFRRVSRPAYTDQRRELAATVGRLVEDLNGADAAVVFGRDADRRAALAAGHRAYLDAEYRAMRARNRFFPLLVGVEGLVVVAVVCIGGAMAMNGGIGLGVVATFALALGQVFGPLRQLSTWVDLLQAASVALRRIADAHTPDVPSAGASRPLPERGDLEMDGVGFGYSAGRPVLDDVTLRVRPGERVALTGPTGVGKSTVARLLVRWIDPDVGAVRFGGVDLREADPADLRRRVLFVPQEGLRLPGTVRDVLALIAPAATDAAIEAALTEITGDRVRPDDDTAALPDGHAQLVVLAAVLLADPAAVILDEATSALDPAVAAHVDAALDRVRESRAVLVIAHRADTVARCDRELRLDGGRLRPGGDRGEERMTSAEQ